MDSNDHRSTKPRARVEPLGEQEHGDDAGSVVTNATQDITSEEPVQLEAAQAHPEAAIWAAARLFERGHMAEQTKQRLLGQMRASAESMALALADNARQEPAS